MGVVERSTGSWYDVRRETDGVVFRARLRGRLRLAGSRSTNPVVVGDRVECASEGPFFAGTAAADSINSAGSAGGTKASKDTSEVWIEGRLERRNYIIRRSTNLSRESHVIAANVDQALVVATLFSPATSLEFIDRFLVTCEAYGIGATVALNKIDLVLGAGGGAEALERFVEIYESAGYRVMLTSAVADIDFTDDSSCALTSLAETRLARNYVDVNGLRDYFAGRTTLLSGNSGVGKSTLIGAVSPGLDIRVGEVSRAHGKGMHTTTFSQMYRLDYQDDGCCCGRDSDGHNHDGGGGHSHDCGGDRGHDCGGDCNRNERAAYVIDTPGVKGFGLVDISPAELSRYFPEMLRYSVDCEYYNCTHTHEPGCAVRRAVEQGGITEERYVSYLKMLEQDGKHR